MDTWDGLEWKHDPARSSDREDIYVLARHGEVLEHEGAPVTDVRLVPGWAPTPAVALPVSTRRPRRLHWPTVAASGGLSALVAITAHFLLG